MDFKFYQDLMTPYQNTLVLDTVGWEIVRLVDVSQDVDDEDYYWVYDSLKKRGDQYPPCRVFSTCVVSWMPLKGVIPDDVYRQLLHCWNINHPIAAE